MGDDGADAGIGDIAGDHAAGVDEIGGEGVLVDDVVVHSAHDGDVFHEPGGLAEVLGEAHAGHAGLDGVVERARLGGLAEVFAEVLRVKGIDLPHATAEPD